MGDWYLMHKMQSGGWLALSIRYDETCIGHNTSCTCSGQHLAKELPQGLQCTLQKQSGCFNHRVVTQVAVSWRTVVMKGLLW